LPFEEVAGGEFFDAFNKGEGLGDVVALEEGVEAGAGDAAGDFGVGEDGFEFGAEVEFALVAAEVEGFDAHAVAGEDEALAGGGVEGDPEHAAEAGEDAGVPGEEALEDDFGIGVGVEVVAEGGEFGAEFAVVIDLAVEDDDGVAVGGIDGLFAAGEINDAEADGTEGDVGGDVDAPLVGAAMVEGLGGRFDSAGGGGTATMGEAGYSAHRLVKPLF